MFQTSFVTIECKGVIVKTLKDVVKEIESLLEQTDGKNINIHWVLCELYGIRNDILDIIDRDKH